MSMIVTLVFTITKKRGAKPFEIVRDVDVPDEWHALTTDEQREFLIKPRLSTEIHGRIQFERSRFQEVFDDPVFDFEFEELNTASNPTALSDLQNKGQARPAQRLMLGR